MRSSGPGATIRSRSFCGQVTSTPATSNGFANKAQSEATKTRLREQTDAARRTGIFGAPTFFVGTEMFWGNDRLDDALAHAAAPGQVLSSATRP